MIPIEFKHQNTVFAKDQPEYTPLPALKIDSKEGEVISCWKLSFKERLKILFTGKVWMSLVMFNKPLTPSYLSVNRKDVYSVLSDKRTFLSVIKEMASELRYSLVSDPVKGCDLYKDRGCSHVDGMLCDYPECSMYKDYLKHKRLIR